MHNSLKDIGDRCTIVHVFALFDEEQLTIQVNAEVEVLINGINQSVKSTRHRSSSNHEVAANIEEEMEEATKKGMTNAKKVIVVRKEVVGSVDERETSRR